MTKPTLSPWLSLSVTIIIINALAFLSSVPVMQGVKSWYNSLEQSCLTPPDWVFTPLWTLLYTMMAIAVWRVWRYRETRDVRPAVGIFLLQLVFNLMWTPIFFGMQEFTFAFIDITILAVLIAVTIRKFLEIDPLAGRLMMPYLLWIAFAAYLNGYIAFAN